VGQAHPLKDHLISVADIPEPPTVLLSSTSSRKVTEPLSVGVHVGMKRWELLSCSWRERFPSFHFSSQFPGNEPRKSTL
jgi:hypothetical protein